MQRSRILQLRVTAALAALIVGFVGAAAYVPYALWSLTQQAEEIHQRHTTAVATLAELRGCGRALRQPALRAFVERGTEAHAALEAEVERARARCAAAIQRHARDMSARTETPDPGRGAWDHFLAHDVPAHEAAVDALLEGARSGERDPRLVHRLFDAVQDGDSHLQSMIEMYSAQAERNAGQIQAALQRLSSWYLGLAALGAGGALLLLLETMRFIRRYARAVDRQVARLDAFGGHVAHDLRGPLHTVRLAVGAIQKRAGDPAVQRLAQGAAAGVARLDAMIGDLLQFARGGAAHAGGAASSVPAVVAETCEDLRAAAEEARVKLTSHAEPALVARIAPVALKAIVSNLVENAIKYRSRERETEVVVTAARAGGEVRITVSDSGPGIRPDILPHLFEPFVRGSERPDSYGLGLATVKRLVDAHRGTITVDSSAARGTSFTICLPAAPSSGAARPAGAVGRRPGAGEAPPSRALDE